MTRSSSRLAYKQRPHLKQIPNVVFVGGGMPIKARNEIIGAVVVSGAPGEELDEACAKAGIAKLADDLRSRIRSAHSSRD